MKKLLSLAAIAFIFIMPQAQAKIWRVNNITGVNANFTNLSDAVNSASVLPGDTIHIESSPNGYGGATITKRLVILGTGNFLTETSPMVANPKTEANTNPSQIGSIYFNPGSKGSVIAGVFVNGYVILQDSLITVQRNYINSPIYLDDSYTSYSTNGDTIRQNYMVSVVSGYNSTGIHKNVLIYNNIITGSSAIDFGYNINNISGFIINNDFTYVYSQYNGNNIRFTSANFVYQNNISGYVDFGAYASSNVYFNNILMGTGIPAGNGNVQNADVANAVYNDWVGNGAGFSTDSRFKLKTGTNPAVNGGTINSTTVDCGAFGGPAPYVLSGMPNAPSIYALTVPTQIASGTATMNITLSSASH